MRITLRVWRQKSSGRRRPDGHLRGRRRQRAHVLPGDARRAQRAAHAPGRGPDRVRPRLPRRDLRHVRPGDQRRRPRPAKDHHLPAAHAHSSTTATSIDIEPWRAEAFPVIKDLVVDRSAFDRIIQAGGYISAPTGTAPDAHAVPVPEGGRRSRLRRRHLHRLRRLRGGLPERLGDAVHRREDHPPGPAAAGPARAALPRA